MILINKNLRWLLGLFLLPLCCKAIGGEELTTSAIELFTTYQNNQYAISMPLTRNHLETLKKHKSRYSYLLLYIDDKSIDQQNLVTMNIGFFPSRHLAEEFADASNHLYLQQNVIHISAAEHAQVVKSAKTFDQNNRFLVLTLNSQHSYTTQLQTFILSNAKSIYAQKDYYKAAEYYQILAAIADDVTAAWAQELAGLCYEKMGEKALAISQYQELLEAYPNAAGADRVRQRLMGLQTESQPNKEKLAKARQSKNTTNTRGVFGQFYRSANRKINNEETDTVLSLLTTDWDIRTNIQRGQHTFKLRSNGYWAKDQLNSRESEWFVKRILLTYQHAASGTEAKLGRQRDSKTGVFTSFDGISLNYPITSSITIGVSGGTPVYSSDIFNDLDYSFYSANLSWKSTDNLTLNSYFTQQTVNGVTDREAYGLQANYSYNTLTLSSSIDYDSAFSELNNLLINATYAFTDNTYTHITYGKQRSPFLTASNIFIGQADLNLDTYLQRKENKDNLLDDALKRTSMNDYYMLSLTQDINEHARWNIDYYQSVLSDIPSTELLLGIPETTTEMDTFHYKSIGAQLILQNMLVQRDSLTLGIRSNQGDTSHSQQLSLTDRLIVGNKLTIIPKFIYVQTTLKSNDAVQDQLRYSLELNYRPWRSTEFTLEAGNQSIKTVNDGNQYTNQYIFAGYRIRF